MAQILATVQAILMLLPLIIQAIDALENLFPQQGIGAQKLGVLKSMIQSAYETTGSVTTGFATLWPAIEKVVSSIVSVKNTLTPTKSP